MYIGAGVGFVNTILLYPKIFPKAEYGLISLIVGIAMLVSSVSNFGTPNALIRYFPKYRDEQDNSDKGLVRYLFSLNLVIALGVALLMIVFQHYIFLAYEENAEMLVDYYYYIFPIFFAQVFNNLLASYLNVIKKSHVQVIQKEILIRLGQTLLIGVYFLGYIDLGIFMKLYVLLYALSFFLLLGYLIKVGELRSFNLRLNKEHRTEVFKFSMFTFLSAISRQLSFRIDSIMVGAMIVSAVAVGLVFVDGGVNNSGLEAVGVYMVALNMASMLDMPFRALNQSLAPSVAIAWAQKDMDKISELYQKSTETMMVIGVYIVVGIWACVDQILEILPDSYRDVKYVLGWLLLGKILNVVAGPNGVVLMNSPKYRLVTYLSVIGLLLTLVSNYFFISWFQIEGAAMATFATYLILNFVMWAFILMLYKLQPFTLANLMTLMLGIGILYLMSFINIENIWITIMLKASIITAVYWGVVYVLKLSPEVNKLIDYKLLSKLRKKG